MKKKQRKKMGIWSKYVVLLVITIVLGFIVNAFLFIPIPTLADENGWLGFYGSLIGAGIAGIITLWGIEYTIKTTVMNAKPCIRPVRTDFFLYKREGNGLFVTEKTLTRLMNEYSEMEKVDLFDIDELILGNIVQKLALRKKGSKWENILNNLNLQKLCNLIKNVCEYHTYKEALDILSRELDRTYRNGVGRVIFDELLEVFWKNIAFEVISRESHKWGVFFSIYNTGAGNATDIRIEWDFSKNYHKVICDNLGFSQEEYKEMLKNFSLENIETAEADVMLNTNGDNVVRVQIPGEIILLVKNLYLKEGKNGLEKKYENNNALVGEHEFAELNISCKDIYGEEHYFHYIVMFRIQPTLWSEYGCIEHRFYFKFDNC